MKLKILVVAGDGIGPEVTNEAVAVLKQIAEQGGHEFSFAEKRIGGVAIVQDGTPYRLRVPVLLETRDGQPVRDIIEVTGPVTHFELRADSPPVRLILDPDGVLPLVRPAGEAGAGSTIFSFR